MPADSRIAAMARFQHTAARRRLPDTAAEFDAILSVSTHSRAEAAACLFESGIIASLLFQHTAARRRLQGNF